MNHSGEDIGISNNSDETSQEKFEMLEEIALEKYVFRLYVANSKPKSLRAINQIKNLCEERLKGRYELEVIDIYQHPELLEEDQVFASPTLIKKLPLPLQKLIGDMSDTEKLMICLDL